MIGQPVPSHLLCRLLRSAVAKLLICAGLSCAHGSADEVMGHAIGAPEQDGHIRGPGNLPADRAVMAADRGILLPPAPSRRGPAPEPPCGAGLAARSRGVAVEMTQQDLARVPSVLLER